MGKNSRKKMTGLTIRQRVRRAEKTEEEKEKAIEERRRRALLALMR